MLCPQGADFFVRRKFAAPGFRQRYLDISFFFGREFVRRLLHARELKENPCKLVLHLVGEDSDGLNGLFKQAGHIGNIAAAGL
jgi:hypothetical protein